jgi:hypothetical protein
MPSTIRRFWSRLIDLARPPRQDAEAAVRLAQKGADELWQQPPWDFPNRRQPDEQPSPDAVTNAHDKRKNLDHADAGGERLEAMGRSHRGLAKGLVVGAVLGIISCSLFRHYERYS